MSEPQGMPLDTETLAGYPLYIKRSQVGDMLCVYSEPDNEEQVPLEDLLEELKRRGFTN